MGCTIAVIGGTGVYDPGILDGSEIVTVETPYGAATVSLGTFHGRRVAFMARHGEGHSVPPHRVNYRANMAALNKLGVERVLATAAVGSLNPVMAPGHLVAVDQFIDLTKSRPQTFFEGGQAGVVHTDMTQPYCPELRDLLRSAAGRLGLVLHHGGTYVCTEGPRFETPAEIKMIRMVGGDLVGMTGVPEVVLARELGMCYAAVAMVTNFAAGISPTRLSHQEVLEVMGENAAKIRRLLMEVIDGVDGTGGCPCRGA